MKCVATLWHDRIYLFVDKRRTRNQNLYNATSSKYFIYTFFFNYTQVSSVGCGYSFTVAADQKRPKVWTAGLNSFSQLGRQLGKKGLKGMMCNLVCSYIV